MKTTIELAREAGFTEGELAFMGDNFRRFAELVRADEREQSLRREKFIAERWAIECASQAEIEREACAKVCEARAEDEVGMAYEGIALDCAAAIRARGNV